MHISPRLDSNVPALPKLLKSERFVRGITTRVVVIRAYRNPAVEHIPRRRSLAHPPKKATSAEKWGTSERNIARLQARVNIFRTLLMHRLDFARAVSRPLRRQSPFSSAIRSEYLSARMRGTGGPSRILNNKIESRKESRLRRSWILLDNGNIVSRHTIFRDRLKAIAIKKIDLILISPREITVVEINEILFPRGQCHVGNFKTFWYVT